MDRNEARKAAEVMLAYADGKEIEWKDRSGRRNNGKWVSNNLVHFNWENNDYRIKPEPKYHPFKDAEECWQEMQKHTPFGWVQDKDNSSFKQYILSVDKDGVMISDYDDDKVFISYEAIFKHHTFVDDSPIGIKEKEV